MKISRFLLLSFLLILTASFLSSCTGSGSLPSGWPGLLVNENTGFLANSTRVYSINLENGSLNWKHPLDKADEKGKGFYAAPVLTGDGKQLIVSGYDHILYSLDPNTGTTQWTFPRTKDDTVKASDRYIGSPLVTSEGIFAPNADGFLYALDLQGNQLWPPFQTSGPLWAQPVTDEKCQCLYISSMDHHLYSVDAATGKQLWQSPDLGAAVVASPIYDENGTLFVGTFGNEMLALDSATGEIKWRYTTANWVWSTAVLKDGKIYFGDLDGFYYALSTTGNQIWANKADGLIVGTPLLKDDLIYFGTENGSVYAVTLEGNGTILKNLNSLVLNDKTVNGKIYAPILSYGDLLLVTPSESEALLVALTSTGELKWPFVAPK
jgi:outer membrane protein assembly factor BamB